MVYAHPYARYHYALAPMTTSRFPWLVLAVSAGCALLAWQLLRQAIAERARAQFDAHVQRATRDTEQRMRAYEQTLHGAAGLFTTARNISRSDWRGYVANLRIDKYYPGIQAIGYAEAVTKGQLAVHASQIRAEGYPNYSVHPAGDRDRYAPVRYVEPFAGTNLRALGYDMYSEPVRLAAMLRARDSGEATLSGKLTLIQDEQATRFEPGTVLYVPVYRQGASTTTGDERAAALLGYVYASFRINDLMIEVLRSHAADIDIEIFDGMQATPATLLFDGDGSLHAFAPEYPAPLRSVQQVSVANRTWTLNFAAHPDYLSNVYGITPGLALLGGSAISLLLFGLTWAQANTRVRAQTLAEDMTSALQESEARLDGIIRGAAEAIIMTDADQRIVMFNPAAERMFRCSAEQASGAPLERFIPQRFREAHRAHVQAFAHTGESTRSMGIDLQLHALRADGEEFPIDASISRVEHNGKKFFAVLLRDIKRRLEADARVRRSEQQLAEAQAVAHIGSYELNLRPRDDYNWSAEMLRIVGLEQLPQDWSSLTYAAQLVHPDDRGRLMREFRRMLKERDGLDIEYRIVRSDGELRWVRDLAKPTLGADGKIDKLIGTVQDITERKVAENAVLAANEFNRQIMTSINEGIIVYDRELRAAVWNPFMVALTGLPPAQVIGRHIYEIFPGLREQPVHQSLERALAGEAVVASEPIGRIRGTNEFLPLHEQVPDDPRIAWTITSWAPRRDQSGEIIGVIVIVLDVTQLKRSQDQLQQSNDKLRQLSAHLESVRESERARIAREIHDELAGTLTGIKMDLSASIDLAEVVPALHAKLSKSKQLVDNAVQTTRRIINDLRPSILDNLGVWAAIEWIANDVAERANLRCNVAIDTSAADTEISPAASTALFRIVQESLNNVWRHAEATEVTVRGHRSGDKVRVEITDDGKGVSDADLAKTGHWGVMGMHERAKSHGGSVHLESISGSGTTVRVELPIASAEPSPIKAPAIEPAT